MWNILSLLLFFLLANGELTFWKTKRSVFFSFFKFCGIFPRHLKSTGSVTKSWGYFFWYKNSENFRVWWKNITLCPLSSDLCCIATFVFFLQFVATRNIPQGQNDIWIRFIQFLHHIDHGKMGHPTSPLCAKLVAGRFSQWRWLPRCIRNFVFEVLAAPVIYSAYGNSGNIQVISKSSAPTIQQILMKHDLFNLSWLVNLPSPNVPPPQKKKR